MSEDPLSVSVKTDKSSYAAGELPEFHAEVKTASGEPVEADLQWGLRLLPGDWVDYSREFPVRTLPDSGAATWRWPGDDIGPPDPGDWEMVVDARAYDNSGEGSAELAFQVEQP
jgi:hypothetical protein